MAFFSGSGVPSSSTLAAGNYTAGDTYLDTSLRVMWTCVSMGTQATSAWNKDEFVSLRGFGAAGNGTTNDSAAWNAAMATGAGAIHISDGTYLLNSPNPVPNNVKITSEANATLLLGSTLQIGSKTAKFTNIDVALRAQQSGTTSPLVACYNLAHCRISAELVGGAVITGDFAHVRSTNSVGNVDNIYSLWATDGAVPSNGLVIGNGDASIASQAGDFINGNLFFKCDLPATTLVMQFFHIGSVPGSAGGTISRNRFFRCDLRRYAVGGLAVKTMTSGGSGGVSYNEFDECTFEGTGANTLDIDLVTNPQTAGQFFRHPITTFPYATQKLNPNDLWVDSQQDAVDYLGAHSQIFALKVANRQYVTTGAVSTSSTTFVSSGIGTGAITPSVLAELEIILSLSGSNNTAGDGVRVALYRTTGSIPGSGSPPGGSDAQVWMGDPNTEVGTGGGFNFPYFAYLIDGAVSNATAYRYYIALQAINGGTAQIDNVYLMVREA